MRDKDIKGVVKRQHMYSTLAEQEGRYAEKQASKEEKSHKPEMAKDSEREAKIAFGFAAYRKRIAEDEAKKLKGKK